MRDKDACAPAHLPTRLRSTERGAQPLQQCYALSPRTLGPSYSPLVHTLLHYTPTLHSPLLLSAPPTLGPSYSLPLLLSAPPTLFSPNPQVQPRSARISHGRVLWRAGGGGACSFCGGGLGLAKGWGGRRCRRGDLMSGDTGENRHVCLVIYRSDAASLSCLQRPLASLR